MAASVDLVLLTDVKTYLGINDSDHDAAITSLIKTVSDRVEKFLGRVVLEATYTEVFDVRPGQQLFRLKAWPVDTAQSFTVKNDADQDWSGATALDATLYVVAPNYGRLQFKNYSLIDGPQALQVAYTGGLAANQAAVPDEIETAAKMFVAEVWRRRKELAATSEGVGGFNVSMTEAVKMPMVVAEILRGHQAPWQKLGKGGR